MTVDEDPQLFKATFEKLMLEKLDGSIVVGCDDKTGDGCHDAAEWVGVCNTCRGTVLYCGPHYNTVTVASLQSGIGGRCTGCDTYGPVETTFTFELLRSPA